VCIGDVWQWGEAAIQICQPRYPCFKMAMATERPKIVKRFLAEGKCGIYFRVLQTGSAPVGGPITVIERDRLGVTVRSAAMALYGNADPVLQREIAEHPRLALRWRAMLLESADYHERHAVSHDREE
jgi:MOSC domain-containing protein YiiM